MKFMAASVPRHVRSTRLSHLRGDAVIGSWHIPNPAGGFQVFDVVMQAETDFMRMKNHLSTLTPMGVSPEAGKLPVTYMLRDTKEIDVPDSDLNPAQTAAAYFKREFKVTA
jgi:hypothetical protein